MRVAFLQHGLGYGGATKSLLLMQKALKDDIECYTILSRTKKINQDIKSQFIYSQVFVAMDIPSIYSYSEGTISLSAFNKNKQYFPKELINYLNNNEIEILHINSSVFSNILKFIKENTKCKVVVHLREMLPFGRTNAIDAYIIENISNYADAIIAISDNEAIHFLPSKKLTVIPNPHDFSETDKYLETKFSNKHSVIIGMCANFKPIKGHLDFLEAARQINGMTLNSDLGIEFRIIGYPKSVKSLKDIIKRIISFGYKSRFDKELERSNITNIKIIPFTFDIYKELSEFDIYVRPDKSGNPWGRDIIEAMALKKPVIATGNSEFFIRNNRNGYLVPQGKPDIMAESIYELILDKSRREEMGANGYNLITTMCNMAMFRERIYKIYS
jgi:glycosyltransferase involved in cell wall biosynthesis